MEGRVAAVRLCEMVRWTWTPARSIDSSEGIGIKVDTIAIVTGTFIITGIVTQISVVLCLSLRLVAFPHSMSLSCIVLLFWCTVLATLITSCNPRTGTLLFISRYKYGG